MSNSFETQIEVNDLQIDDGRFGKFSKDEVEFMFECLHSYPCENAKERIMCRDLRQELMTRLCRIEYIEYNSIEVKDNEDN